MFSHLVRGLVVVFVGASLLGGIACGQVAARKSKKADAGELLEDDYVYEDDEDPVTDLTSSGDAGRINVPSRPSDGGLKDVNVPDDSGPVTPCTGPIKPGDLRIVEVMFASKAATSGDPGEWVEIQNNTQCALNVKGITISSPRGSTGKDSVSVAYDLVIPKYATFLVAGSDDPAKNGGLTGPLLAWQATDVLKNTTDSVEVTTPDGTVIDKISYPDNLGYSAGTTFAFPPNCIESDRANWQRWSPSVQTFGPGGALFGTPNAPNLDVTCY